MATATATQPIRWSNQSFSPGTVARWDEGGLYLTARTVEDGDASARDFDRYSKRQIAAFNRGEWCYVGVVVTAEYISHHEGRIPQYSEVGSASLWGIESDSDEGYFSEVARELAEEALAMARATVAAIRADATV
jgi:hypothetical protein